MSLSAYVAGVISLACIVGPWIVTAPVLRAAVVGHLTGAEARLTEIVLGLAGLEVTAQLTGAFGGFHRWTLAAVSLVVAAAVTTLASRAIGPRPARQPRERRRRRATVLIPIVAVLASSAQWLAGAASSYRTGIVQVESLHYHLTHAAFFVQSGTLWRPHQVSASSDAAFHPLNAELLHAIGMLAFRNDVLSLFLNVLFLWLLFLAAWCVGERFGAGPAAVTAAALLSVALPMGGTSGGNAQNDIVVLALLVAAVGVLGQAAPVEETAVAWTGRAVVAGLALGLAAGTKLTAPGAVLGLLVGWVWVRRRSGAVRTALPLVVPTLLTGSFWYLRDWWFFGSPLPTFGLHVFGVGHDAVPLPALSGETFTIAHYLTNAHVVRHWYVPALHADFGFAWPLVALLPLAGVVLACRKGRSTDDRVLAFAACVAFVVFLVTPSGAQGPPGQPFLFGSNVRYAMPAMILGLLALVRDPWLARRWYAPAALTALELLRLSSHVDWPPGSRGRGIGAAVGCLVVVAVLVAIWRRSPALCAAGAAVVVLAAALVGLPFTRHYQSHRYTRGGTPYASVFRWARSLHHTRVGIVGFPQEYPFYGLDDSNSVVYLGQSVPHHGFNDYTRCSPWVAGVNAARVRYVVVLSDPDAPAATSEFTAWTGFAGGVPRFHDPAASVFVVDRPLSSAGCPDA